MKINCFLGKRFYQKLLSTLVGVAACSGSAFAVDISESEWNTWPPYCKAGFLASEWSSESPFIGRMSPAQFRSIRSANASIGIPGLHHFCVGMVYINRAKNQGSTPKGRETLRNAVREIQYSFARIDTKAPKYSLVTAYYGTALYRQGKHQEAVDMWSRGINAKPASRESYLAMAEALLAEKKAKEALEVLLRYEKAKEDDAADAEAFLAHTYIQLGEYGKAREHTDKAYRLGYPLPGLRNKLERMGKK